MKAFAKRLLAGYLCLCAWPVLRLRRPRIVGVTGSVGKTTAKELIAAVLGCEAARPAVGPVWKTSANMNDLVGLPLSVLGYDEWVSPSPAGLRILLTAPFRALALATVREYPRVLVLEYGAGPGSDLARQARLAPPVVAVVTAVGPAHLDMFGSVEGVVREKGALVRAVPAGGLVVLGDETEPARGMASLSRAPVALVPGRGRALGEAIARRVGAYFGVPDEAAEAALRGAAAPAGRLSSVEVGAVTVIDDSFNANPLSMNLGLDTLAERARPGQRRVAVLGFMAEMGADSARYHEAVGTHARERADLVVGVGPDARAYRPDHWYPDSRSCVEAISGILRPGDLVLLKGSSSAGLPEVLWHLQKIARDAQPPIRA